MHRTFLIAGLLISLTAPALTAGRVRPASEVIAREHFVVQDAKGGTHRFSELLFAGDIEAVVTLWQLPNEQRFILRFTTDHVARLTRISIARVGTKDFLRVSYPIPVAAGSPGEVKRRAEHLTPEHWEVPVSVAAAGFEMTLPPPAEASFMRVRGELRRHITEDFARAAAEVIQMAAQAGSPAGLTLCSSAGRLVADGANCKRRVDAKPVPQPEPNCSFDAQFGYRCPQ